MKKTENSRLWIIVGIVVFIVLLFLWLSEAISVGDTDVNATEAIAYFSNIA